MASGVDHYREGEHLLEALDIPRDAALNTNLSLEERREASAMLHAMATAALAHFTAALAAATALNGAVAEAVFGEHPDLAAWAEAAGVKTNG
ncbi:hypothetical protein ACGF0J_21735 [Nonomuraea sp. NPDC047897]|uniref:hypothetical protein n=1 Tax=Nonomuraea sp. NPDC047897 TaxID=3364346 RepID=UPI0037135EB1